MPVATQRGGAEAILLDAVRHGRRHARWLVVFLEDGPMVQTVERVGAEALVIRAGRVRDLGRLLRTLRELGRALRGWRPDVVVSWMTKGHLYVAPVATLLGIPAYWFQHGIPSTTDPIDRTVTLLPARGVFAPSRTVAAAQASMRPRRPVHVAYPGVETAGAAERDGPGDVVGPWVPEGARVIGMVARLQRWKGVHVAVEALRIVLATQPDAHLVVVGGDHPLEPGYREQLLDLADRLGLADRVHLVGYQADATRWMRACDVIVHASDREPFGIVVLEAMALGKPLVAGSDGGPAEVVREGVDGFLVAYGDAATLADRIGRYLADPDLARRMGEAAAVRAGGFSPARFAEDVLAPLRHHARGRRG
jgi:glycosyltransferase involved in cell wall biosynthesis